MQVISSDGRLKKCTKCGEQKAFSEFGAHKLCLNGINPKCKACNRAGALEWYSRNPERAKLACAAYQTLNAEKVRAAKAANYSANSEKIKASVAVWAATNPEKVKEYKAKWADSNKEKIRANTVAWRSENPEKSRVQVQNRRALKRANGGTLSKNIASKLFRLQRGLCPCCMQPLGDDYHIDHILPIALGGPNTDDNVQLLRQRCNNQKHAKHPVDFMQQRGFLL